jgi:hypothetical protein
LSAVAALTVAALISLPAAAPAGAQSVPVWTVGPVLDLGGPASLRDVAMRGVADVWAVGQLSSRPLVVTWTGTKWTQVDAPAAVELMAVDAVPSSAVWVAGTAGAGTGQTVPLLARYDGVSWQTTPVPLPDTASGRLTDVDMLAGGVNGWAVGSITDNGRTQPLVIRAMEGLWQRIPLPPLAGAAELRAVYATEGLDAWAVGTQWDALGTPSALALHWDGGVWKPEELPRPAPGGNSHLVAVGGDGVGIWAVGEMCALAIVQPACQAMVVNREEQGWRIVPTDGPIGTRLFGLAVLSPVDIWVVGYAVLTDGMKTEHLEHWDGLDFSVRNLRPVLPRDFPAAGLLSTARAPGTGELWAVGWLEHPLNGHPLVMRYQ